METSNERDSQDRRIGPTVSKEKWVNHAKTKLSKGYVLIVGTQRRTANFYQRTKGFEMCPYNVAKQMIKDGLLVEAGQHHLGTMYRLAGEAAPEARPPRVPRPEAQSDEVDDLLNRIESDPDAASAAPSQ